MAKLILYRKSYRQTSKKQNVSKHLFPEIGKGIEGFVGSDTLKTFQIVYFPVYLANILVVFFIETFERFYYSRERGHFKLFYLWKSLKKQHFRT